MCGLRRVNVVAPYSLTVHTVVVDDVKVPAGTTAYAFSYFRYGIRDILLDLVFILAYQLHQPAHCAGDGVYPCDGRAVAALRLDRGRYTALVLQRENRRRERVAAVIVVQGDYIKRIYQRVAHEQFGFAGTVGEAFQRLRHS